MNETMTLADLWLEIGSNLEQKKREVNDEILNYPPPIPACDVQFNHLLEERARIAQELNRMQEAARQDGSIETAYAFIDTCPYIDSSLAERLERTAIGLVKLYKED